MPADVLIVADETDDIRKYIPTIVESFRLLHNNIHVDIASPVQANSGRVYRAKRLLLLLCGSKERATILCQQWRSCLRVTLFTKEKMLAVTRLTTEQCLKASTDDLVKTVGCKIVSCESLDRIEDWIPEFVQTFFSLWGSHETSIGIYNRSPEYPLATETTNSLEKTLIRLGMKIYRDTASPNARLKFDQEVITCVLVLRSSLTRNQSVFDELHNASKDIRNVKRVYLVSTHQSRLTDSGSSSVQNMYGRLDIIEFIVTLLVSLGLVKPENPIRKLLALTIRQCGQIGYLLFKVILTLVIFVMNLVYILFVFILMPVLYILLCDTLMDFLHVKNENRCDCDNNGRRVIRTREGSSCTKYDQVQVICNIILTIGLTLASWTGGLIHDLASVPILVVITIVIILYFIVWYSILHILLFRRKLGYEFGAFSLPYVWWQ